MPQINALYARFQALRNHTAEDGRFTVIPIDDLPHKLGVSQEGFPMLFVRTDSSTSSVQNIIREILSVEYNVSCLLIEDDGTEQEDAFSIITLRSLDAPLQSYFVEIFTMMLHKLQAVPSNRELSVEVENLIAGDSIYYDSSKPHGAIATSKDGSEFLVVSMKGGAKR